MPKSAGSHSCSETNWGDWEEPDGSIFTLHRSSLSNITKHISHLFITPPPRPSLLFPFLSMDLSMPNSVFWALIFFSFLFSLNMAFECVNFWLIFFSLVTVYLALLRATCFLCVFLPYRMIFQRLHLSELYCWDGVFIFLFEDTLYVCFFFLQSVWLSVYCVCKEFYIEFRAHHRTAVVGSFITTLSTLLTSNDRKYLCIDYFGWSVRDFML